jgi:hypothetical protein
MESSCRLGARSDSVDDQDVYARIGDAKGRLAKLLAEVEDDDRLTDELYLTCLSRHATTAERKTVAAFVASAESRRAAYEDVLWSLLNVRDFLFVK